MGMKQAAIAVLLLLAANPAPAQMTDPIFSPADPGDRAVVAEVATAIQRQPDLAKLDAVLVKLPRPTPLRGMVQAMRAQALINKNEVGGAVQSIDEALLLLPDDPRVELIASHIFTFTGAPQRGADLWLAASQQSPVIARQSDAYTLDALIGRLNEIGDHNRADRVSARMGEIGFSTGTAPQRSDSVLAAVRAAVKAGNMDDAAARVTGISDPSDLAALYLDRRYSALWPRIAEWAGSDLSKQSARFLEELRRDWETSETPETAVAYARGLAGANAPEAVIALFLPVLNQAAPGAAIGKLEFLAAPVARALTQRERTGEAKALLGKLEQTFDSRSANILNVDGAYLTIAGLNADWPEALSRADAFLAKAKGYGPDVNRTALLEVTAWRACALTRLGRKDDAQVALAEVVAGASIAPASAFRAYICIGDAAAARTLLVARLADEDTRGWALGTIQPVTSEQKSVYDQEVYPMLRSVQTAPEVVAAANRVGRILPQPILDRLPAGFDPYRTRPAARSADPATT